MRVTEAGFPKRRHNLGTISEMRLYLWQLRLQASRTAVRVVKVMHGRMALAARTDYPCKNMLNDTSVISADLLHGSR